MLFNSIKPHFPFSILLQKVYSISEKKSIFVKILIIGKNSIQANIKVNYFFKHFMNIKAHSIFQEVLTISNDLN